MFDILSQGESQFQFTVSLRFDLRNSPLRADSAPGVPSFINFTFAISFFFPIGSSARAVSSSGIDAARTVNGESLEANDGSLFSDIPSTAVFTKGLIIGVVGLVGVFETLEIVTVVLIDDGCCFSDARCLLSVANDMTI